MSKTNCIFCKIIAGEIPCYKIYEDENVVAFLDIAPVNPGHTLVVPKKHVAVFEDLDAKLYSSILATVKRVATSFRRSLHVQDYNVIVNNGIFAGQMVSHTNFHVIPRHEGDNLKFWPQGRYTGSEAKEMQFILSKNID